MIIEGKNDTSLFLSPLSLFSSLLNCPLQSSACFLVFRNVACGRCFKRPVCVYGVGFILRKERQKRKREKQVVCWSLSPIFFSNVCEATLCTYEVNYDALKLARCYDAPCWGGGIT